MAKNRYILHTFNHYGIKVVKACISCKYGTNGIMMTSCGCTRSEWCGTDMKKSDICKEWRMKHELHAAGKGGGKVKKKGYFEELLKGERSREELQEVWEKHHGGLYERM